MENDFQRAVRLQQRIKELATFSEDPHTVSRSYGTKSFRDCSNKIASWMQEARLETRIDNIGNVRGKLRCDNPHAKTFVIASHFDNSLHSGNYNGVLGILMGIDIAERIGLRNLLLPFHIEVVAFCEKEGMGFNIPYLGSRVVSGLFKNELLEMKDEKGKTLAETLQSLDLNSESLEADAIKPEEWQGYFEIKIEEEPTLYEKNIPIGIVTAISGRKNVAIEFTGKTGYAGTEPMNVRRDALCAAAKFVTAVEKYARKEKRNLLTTIGDMYITDAASDVIPGKVKCTLDIRSDDAELLSEAYEEINALCEKICDKRNIYFEWKLTDEIEPVICNKKFRKLLSGSINEKNIEVVNMISGSGSDAVMISKVAPVAMLFVKCFKRINSHLTEQVEDYDIATALDISGHFMEQMILSPEKLIKKK